MVSAYGNLCYNLGITMNGKLSVREKLGYGTASVGDSIAYSAIGTYLMFFLTTVAGVDPAVSGVISAIGAVWNALINPIWGFLSDQVRTKMGKRRPMMLLFSIPSGICIFLLFTDLNIPMSIKPLYYGFILMLYWTCYTGFFVPYMALGSEYTSDYEDRTVLRLYASMFNILGNVVTMVLPTFMVGVLEKRGMSTGAAWSSTGLFLGTCAAVTFLVTVIASKQKDPPVLASSDARPKLNIVELFREYISVAGLKPMKYLIIASTLGLICYSLLLADLLYFLTYNLGLTSEETPLILLVRPLFAAAMIPVTAFIVKKIDKRGALVFFYGLGAAILLFVRVVGVSGTGMLIVFIIGSATCTSFYWQLMPSIYYDVCEYDLLETGKDRRGAIVSFQGLIESIAAGIGSVILGVILKAAGFDSTLDVQTETAKLWIFNCTTLVPIVFLVLMILAVYKYPLTRERHAEIVRRLREKSKAE